jgi:hypothetical protein
MGKGRLKSFQTAFGVNAKKHRHCGAFFIGLAEWTGLEPATPGVTGRYSNQLNYHSAQKNGG